MKKRKYNRRLKWRKHLAPKSQDFVRGDWSGLFKFSEFFYCYLKFTTRAEWQGGQSKQSAKIEYILNTYDDLAAAPPNNFCNKPNVITINRQKNETFFNYCKSNWRRNRKIAS